MREYVFAGESPGKRFDMGHPAWPVKAGGDKYKVFSAKQRGLLEGQGFVFVPSVTEILRPVSTPPIVDWAFGEGVRLAFSRMQFDNPDFETLLASCNQERWESADRGSEIHAALENVHSEIFAKARERLLAEIKVDIMKGMSEVQFAYEHDGMRFGGTVDWLSKEAGIILDWKTSKKKREPYSNEVAQLWAYSLPFGATRLVNVYILQETAEIYSVKEYTREEIARGERIFRACYGLLEEGAVK
jgi:hypothetical protein